MEWKELGLVYSAPKNNSWKHSHGMCPTPIIFGDIIRVFCGMWDTNKISRIGWVDLYKTDPTALVNISETPCLDIGPIGNFDDNGVVPSSIYLSGGYLYLFYCGFQLVDKIRYMIFSNLSFAKLNLNEIDNIKFERKQLSPILNRDKRNTLYKTAPFLIKDFSNVNYMFFVGGSKTIEINEKVMPVYTIKYAHYLFPDQIDSITIGELKLKPNEFGLAKPFIIRSKDRNIRPNYKMFYCIREKGFPYRLGYAESNDLKNWERKDDIIGIDPFNKMEGFDREELCFASIIHNGKDWLMFYNKRNFGEDGFYVAKLIKW